MFERRQVIIESPFSAKSRAEFSRNMRYLKACFLDSLHRGESPYASHLVFPQMLHDADARERELGMACGFDIAYALAFAYKHAKPIGMQEPRHVFYVDHGMSRGMKEARDKFATVLVREDRHLGDDWESRLDDRQAMRHLR